MEGLPVCDGPMNGWGPAFRQSLIHSFSLSRSLAAFVFVLRFVPSNSFIHSFLHSFIRFGLFPYNRRRVINIFFTFLSIFLARK